MKLAIPALIQFLVVVSFVPYFAGLTRVLNPRI